MRCEVTIVEGASGSHCEWLPLYTYSWNQTIDETKLGYKLVSEKRLGLNDRHHRPGLATPGARAGGLKPFSAAHPPHMEYWNFARTKKNLQIDD